MRELFVQIRHLLRLEFRHWPQSVALLLFMWTIAYVMYRVRGELSRPEFNLIFWIFLLLISINVAIQSNSQHSTSQRLLTYTLVSPMTALIGRVFFNVMFLSIAAFAFYGSLLLLFSDHIAYSHSFALLILTGCAAIGTVTAFVSAMSQQMTNQGTILSILVIPVLIPMTILLHSIGGHVIMGNQLQGSKYLAIGGITLLSFALSTILFPYIWKE